MNDKHKPIVKKELCVRCGKNIIYCSIGWYDSTGPFCEPCFKAIKPEVDKWYNERSLYEDEYVKDLEKAARLAKVVLDNYYHICDEAMVRYIPIEAIQLEELLNWLGIKEV